MAEFGGTWTKHNDVCESLPIAFKQFDQQIQTIVPALGTLIIRPEQINTRKAKKVSKWKGEKVRFFHRLNENWNVSHDPSRRARDPSRKTY